MSIDPSNLAQRAPNLGNTSPSVAVAVAVVGQLRSFETFFGDGASD